jgi:hypothetical protein
MLTRRKSVNFVRVSIYFRRMSQIAEVLECTAGCEIDKKNAQEKTESLRLFQVGTTPCPSKGVHS